MADQPSTRSSIKPCCERRTRCDSCLKARNCYPSTFRWIHLKLPKAMKRIWATYCGTFSARTLEGRARRLSLAHHRSTRQARTSAAPDSKRPSESTARRSDTHCLAQLRRGVRRGGRFTFNPARPRSHFRLSRRLSPPEYRIEALTFTPGRRPSRVRPRFHSRSEERGL